MKTEIDLTHRISLDGFIEQPLPWQCPDCKDELTAKNIIGFGLYPLGGWHSQMKPNNHDGVGFECPKCFCKSCFHSDDYVYHMFLDIKRYKL